MAGAEHRARSTGGPGLLAVLALAGAYAQFSAGAAAESELIAIDVGVERQRGRGPLPRLTAADFEVRCGSIPCPVASVEYGLPLSLVVVADGSPSMPLRPRALASVLEQSVLSGLKAGDRARAMWTGGSLLPRAFSADSADLRAALRDPGEEDDVARFGPSPIWDGVYAAVAALDAERGRRAVLLVTDGRASGDIHGRAATLERAVAAGVVISVVGLPQGWSVGSRYQADPGRPLREAASVTGGSYAAAWPPSSARAVRRAVAAAIEDVQEMYTIRVAAPVRDGRVHQLEVHSTRDDVRVRSRRAFVAPR